ncbi:MAG: DpnD/PcfM family protein [Rikenellaceae bacterium]
MKKYTVTIKETLTMEVSVTADSQEDAEEIIRERYEDEGYVLSWNEWDGVTFAAKEAVS